MTLGTQWRAVQREAQLAAEQAAHGVTVLGRANHAQTGLYTQAFFGLSIGLERMGKLIFLADHAIRSDGASSYRPTICERLVMTSIRC